MKRIVKLNERDLSRIIKRAINEGVEADDNVSSEQLSFTVFDQSKERDLPIQSTSVTERAININLKKSYRFDKSEEIMLKIHNNDLSVPLLIEKAEILNGPLIMVGGSYYEGKTVPVFIKVKDVKNIENFTIILYGNFTGGELTVNITSKGSTIKESNLSRIIRRAINEGGEFKTNKKEDFELDLERKLDDIFFRYDEGNLFSDKGDWGYLSSQHSLQKKVSPRQRLERVLQVKRLLENYIKTLDYLRFNLEQDIEHGGEDYRSVWGGLEGDEI